MRVLGIDPDTRSMAFVVLGTEGGTGYQYGKIEVKGRTAEDRIQPLWVRLQFESLPARSASYDWAYIESPMLGRNPKATVDQAQVVGMLRGFLWYCGCYNHTLVNNMTWKKSVLGNGKATKEEIAEYARRMLGLPPGLSQDIYDAACIARFGLLKS